MLRLYSLDRESRRTMEKGDFLDEVHVRILRVTEDLRAIQQTLNCAAMQAPGDPELMEALCQLPEIESLQVLKSALDQMRHFIWFYMQVMTNESEDGDRLRQSLGQKPAADGMVSPRVAAAEKVKRAADTPLLPYLSGRKVRKPKHAGSTRVFQDQSRCELEKCSTWNITVLYVY